jgi:glycosyltransferase involved in cell wall biosynthesis
VIPNGRTFRADASGYKEPLVLTAGRSWDAAKNIAVLEEIANQLPWLVCVAGPDAPRQPASVPNVRRLGVLSQTEIWNWQARASIYAHPAKYEPFGLAILEAASARCALVLGDIPSLKEIWRDAALFVDPRDPDHLAHVIHRLIAQPGLRLDIAKRARSRAIEFTLERMVGSYMRVYALLLEPAKNLSSPAFA